MAVSVLQDGHAVTPGDVPSGTLSWATTGAYRNVFLIVYIYGTATPTVSDTAITWSLLASENNVSSFGDPFAIYVYGRQVPSSTSGTTTVSVSSGSVLGLMIDSFYKAGYATAPPILSIYGTYSGTSSAPSGVLTTLNPYDQVIAYEVSTEGNTGVGSGFVSTGTEASIDSHYNLLGEIATAYTPTPSAVTVDFSNSTSEPWVMIAFALTGTPASSSLYGNWFF